MPDSKPGPVLNEHIDEVQGVFATDLALQDGIRRLTLLGFDRAQISLPAARPHAAQATPTAGAADPMTDADKRQARTLGTSGAAAAGAMLGAGLTVATGGAAGLAIAAAAGLAAVAGGTVLAATNAAGDATAAQRDQAATAGELVLSVSVHDAAGTASAEAAMKDAGATFVAPVRRTGGALV